MRSQIATASAQRSRSQFATLKRGHNIKYRPCAITEHGAIMAATVLNSSKEDPSAAPACLEQRRGAASGTRQDEDRLRCPRGETKILPEDHFEEVTMTDLRQQIADWYNWAKHLIANGKIAPHPDPMRRRLMVLAMSPPIAIQVHVAANARSVSLLGQQCIHGRVGAHAPNLLNMATRNRRGHRTDSWVWRMRQDHWSQHLPVRRFLTSFVAPYYQTGTLPVDTGDPLRYAPVQASLLRIRIASPV